MRYLVRPILVLSLVASAALSLCWMTWRSVAAQQATAFVTVSAASYRTDSIAPESIVAGFGVNLSTLTASGRDSDPTTPGIQLPTTLVGTTVRVNNVPAPLFYVSPGQINYLIPANTPLGDVLVTVTTESGATAIGTVNVRLVAPAIFTANADGSGVPAAYALRVAANGAQTTENISAFSQASNRILATPINLGPEGEKVFLIIYPTGLRRIPDPNNDGNFNEFTRVIINGLSIVPAYAGRQGSLVGLDQVNVEIPRSLLGSSALDVQIVVAGFGVSNITEVELVAPPVTALSFRALGLPNRTIRAFTTIGSYLFAATDQGVWCSSDSGTNWINASNGLPANADVRTFFVDGTTLYAGLYGGGGVCVSTNNGASWTALNSGLVGSTLNISSILLFGGRLYAATQGGVCRYVNGLWQAINSGITNVDAATLLIFNGRLCVGTRGGGIFLLGTSFSTPAWTTLNNGLPSGAQVISFASAGTAVYAGLNGGGLCVSRNGGALWTQVAGGLPTSAVINSIWIDGTRCYVGTATGLYVTNDGGTTWNPLSNGLSGCSGANNTNAVFAFASRLLAGSTGCGVYGSALAAGGTNRAPIANPQTVALNEDTQALISLSGFDADLDPLTYQIVTNPTRGSLSNALPNVIYTPNPNANGADSFTFRVSDGTTTSAPVTVSLIVNPVNDAPTANAQNLTLQEDTNRAVVLTGNDLDGDALTYSVVTSPANGALTGTPPNLTYTPAANFAGSDSFTFKVNDGKVDSSLATITLNVTQVNDPPVLIVPAAQNVLAGQNVSFVLDVSDPDRAQQSYTYSSTNLPVGATITPSQDLKTATFSWTPGSNGTTTINFIVTDNGNPPLNDTKSVTVTVSGPSPIGNWISLRGNLPKVNNFDIGVRNLEAIGNRLFAATEIGVFTSTFVNGVWDANWVAVNTGIGANDRNIEYLSVVGTRVFVHSISRKIYVSDNNGTSWTPLDLGFPVNPAYSVFFVKGFGDKLYVGTNFGIQISSDNGATWSRPLPSFPPNGAFNFLSLENTFYVLTNANPTLRRSDNGGVTFASLGSGFYFNKDSTVLLGATLFSYAITNQNQQGIYRSTNGGNAWSLVTNTAPFNAFGAPIFYSANNLLFISGTSASGSGVYFSGDLGATWQKMDAGAAPTGSTLLSSFGNFLLATNPLAYTVMPSTAANTAPALTVPATQEATVGQQLMFNVSATDANNGQTITLSGSSLPLGASFIPATGKFSWTPAVAGSFTIGFSALDNGTPALSQTKTVRINVAPPANPPNGFWSQGNAGLELAGNVYGFTSAGNKLFAKTEGGVYRFESGTWQSFSNGLPAVTAALPQARLIQDLVADGGNLYALLTSGLYRSTDLGVNWTKLSNATLPPLAVNSYAMSVRGSTVLIVGLLGANFFQRSTDGGVNFAPTGGSATSSFTNTLQLVANDYYVANFSNVLRSANNGGTFTALAGGLAGQAYSFTANGQTLFAASTSGVFRSTDNGATWTAANNGLPQSPAVYSLHYGAPFLFAGTTQGVYYSLNNGANWMPIIEGDVPQRVESMHVFDGKLWCSAGTRSYGQPAFNSYQGVYVTPVPVISGNQPPTITVNDTYNATTGTALNFNVTAAGPEAAQTVTLSAIGLPSGATFNAATGAFSWTPPAPGTYYASFTATDNGTPAITTNKTVTFNVTGAALLGNWAAASSGIPANTTIRGLGALSNVVFAATSAGLYKTTNNGGAWTLVAGGLTAGNFYSVSNVNDTLYVGGLNLVFSSNDGGDSWTQLGTPGIFNAIVGVVGSGNTLVAMGDGSVAATTSRAFVSTNFGQTWTVSTTGLPTGSYKNIVLRGSSIFAGGSSFSNVNEGIVRTDNNGASWAASGTGLATTAGSAGPFYLAVKGTDLFAGGVNNGVSRSTNNGASWTDANGAGGTALPVASATYKAIAANASLVFAAGNQSVYFTTNDGVAWTAMSSGDSVPGAVSLLIVGTRIYAATPSSVFVSPLPGQ